jgi:hypothetical protein
MNLQRQAHWPTTVKRGNSRAKFLVHYERLCSNWAFPGRTGTRTRVQTNGEIWKMAEGSSNDSTEQSCLALLGDIC